MYFDSVYIIIITIIIITQTKILFGFTVSYTENRTLQNPLRSRLINRVFIREGDKNLLVSIDVYV